MTFPLRLPKSLPLLSLVALLASGPAWAQSEPELTRARQLYSQGLTQEAAGDWAGALSTFQQVSRIRMTPPVRFHIARCQENLGRLNEALGGYRLAEYEAEREEEPKPELLDEIRKARDALEARLPKLVVERGVGAGTLKIELDGVALGPAKVGREVSVDPGPHSVAGVLADGRRFELTVDVAEGQTERITLDVPEALRTTAAPPTVGADERNVNLEPVAGSSSALPWLVTGVGVASLAASGVFFLLRNQAQAELDRECLGRVCPDTMQSTQDQGRTYATLTGVTLGIGVVGVSVGTILLLSRPKAQPTGSLQLRVGSREIQLQGSF